MEELIQTKLLEVMNQSCLEHNKVYAWRGKVNESDNDEWKIICECLEETESFLIKIKKRK